MGLISTKDQTVRVVLWVEEEMLTGRLMTFVKLTMWFDDVISEGQDKCGGRLEFGFKGCSSRRQIGGF